MNDTDRSGRASAIVTLGSEADTSVVEAGVDGLPAVRFGVKALPGGPAAVEASLDTVRLLAIGDSTRVEAAVVDRFGNTVPDTPVAWSSTDTAVAVVDAAGVVRSRAPGTAELVMTSASASGTATIVVEQQADSVDVQPYGQLFTAIDDSIQLSAKAFDANGYEIASCAFRWSSPDTSVATVSPQGVVVARGPGEVRVQAAVGEAWATSVVRVEPQIADLLLSAPSDTLREVGDTLRLRARALDRNGHEIPRVELTWESNRPSVATVSDSGVVMAQGGRGDVRIKVTAGSQSATRTVTRIPWGVLVLTFDDAHQDVYTRVLPLLKKHGLVANIALPTGWVGQTIAGSPRLTETEIRALHDEGWSIVPHSVDHPDLTYLNPAQVDRQLRESQQWVRDRGFRGGSVFIVPFHRWYEDERAAVEEYFVAARGYGLDHEHYGGMVDWPAPDPYLLTSINAGPIFDTEAGRDQMEAWWGEAVSNGKFLGTYFHSIDASEVAALEDVVRRLVAFKAHLRTYGDLFEP